MGSGMQFRQPTLAIRGEYGVGRAVCFGYLQFFEDHMVFVEAEGNTPFGEQVLYGMVPLVGVGFVVAVGMYGGDGVFFQHFPPHFLRVAIFHEQGGADAMQFEADLPQGVVYESHASVGRVIKLV